MPALEPDTAEPAPAAEPEAPPPAFTKRALLESIGACALGHAEKFQVEANLLAEATQSYASTLSASDLALVQQTWFTAMLEWQRAELFQFGPAALPSEPGGRGLRDQIYAWNGNPPGSHRCRIEQRIVRQSYVSPDFANDLGVVQTLSAFEFLTFYAGTDTACTQFDDIVADGSWAALDATELATRRAGYADAIAKSVSARAADLVQSLVEFRPELASAGDGSDLFDTEQSGLNAVANALFYLDSAAKDDKLAMPLGLVPECPRTSCPEAFESQYARISTLELFENLNGFEELYAGCGPDPRELGFDDWLVAVGAEDLASRMQSAVDDAQQTVATLEPPLEDALLVDPQRVLDVHTDIKAVTDLLKSEFVTVLNLELPSSVASDTD